MSKIVSCTELPQSQKVKAGDRLQITNYHFAEGCPYCELEKVRKLLREACDKFEDIANLLEVYQGVSWHEDSDVNGVEAGEAQDEAIQFLDKPEIKAILGEGK